MRAPQLAILARRIPLALTITSDQTNLNLYTWASANGYTSGNCTITVQSGVDIYSTSPGTPACVPGSFPSGAVVRLVIASGATISGAGGPGGAGGSVGGSGPPVAGTAGGTALDASAVSGFTFEVQNLGTLRGGGGGGGGQGMGDGDFVGADSITETNGGGGGGGGRGRNNAAGGAAGQSAGDPSGVNGNAGTAGSNSAAGTGGANGQGVPYGNGGNGGDWGTAGSAGANGYAGGPSAQTGAAAGAAGKSVNGTSNISWIANGTRTGPVA